MSACGTSGCGSLGPYLDTSTVARSQWTQIRAHGSVRWYCTDACIVAALTADAAAPPLQLAWDNKIVLSAVPDGTGSEARVSCTMQGGGRAVLDLGQEQRLALAGLLDIETVRDINRQCGTPGCGTPVIGTDSPDHPRWWGWTQVRVLGVDVGLRWACSAPCVFDALARAGAELQAQEEAGELRQERARDALLGLDPGPGW